MLSQGDDRTEAGPPARSCLFTLVRARSRPFTLEPRFDVQFADAVLGITEDVEQPKYAKNDIATESDFASWPRAEVRPRPARRGGSCRREICKERHRNGEAVFAQSEAGEGPRCPRLWNRDDRAIRANHRGPLPFGG